ncbi:recombination mediator RecR [Patescibacteria group bacterium]|nr:recombination mediator RecR [Patescibacteria group bacterium]
MPFPKQIRDLIEAFERLPGVGEKTAQRLTFYLLHVPEPEINKLGNAVLNLKKEIFICSICKNISDKQICEICSDQTRDHSTICVVEQPLDVFSLESTGKYHGVYHVLHGVIDPLHNIGPEELYIEDMIERVSGKGDKVKEVILALNPTMEGEATAMYIANKIRSAKRADEFRISRLGMGMPTGGDIQYADETTLSRALEGRRNYE